MIRFLQTPSTAKKIFIGSVLAIISLALVVTLIPGGILGGEFGLEAAGVLARVDGRDITVTEVQQAAQRMARAQNAPPQFLPFFMQRAAESLIDQRVILSEAERMGLRVTDAELADELRRRFGAALFPDGKAVTRERYEDFVASLAQQAGMQLDIPAFESLMRQQILIDKLRALIAAPVTLSDSQVEQEYRFRNTQVKLDYALLSVGDLLKQVTVTEPELRAYFETSAARYKDAIPEKRKLRYVVLDPVQLQQRFAVTRQDLQQYYDERQDQFRVPEQVKVRHILVQTPDPGPEGKPDEAAVKAARAQAEDLLQQLRAGANFEQLAKKHSDDPGSADEGGDLGWVGRGRTVPEFEKASFELEKGKISDIIQTSFGFHIIRADDRQTARLKSLDEVADQIRPVVLQEKVQREIDALAEGVLTRARTAGLEKAAAEKGLPLLTTGFVGRTVSLPGVGVSPQLMEAAFAAREKAPPDLARLREGYAVFEVAEVQPARTPSFEEHRAQIENDFKNERAGQMLPQKLAELSDRARALNHLAAAAREVGATVRSSDWLTPGSQAPDLGPLSGQVSVAFRMKPREISGPIQSGAGGYVFAVVDRKEAPMEEFTASRGRIRDELLEQKRDQVFETFAVNLRQQMEKDGKIRINQQQMQRLTSFGRG